MKPLWGVLGKHSSEAVFGFLADVVVCSCAVGADPSEGFVTEDLEDETVSPSLEAAFLVGGPVLVLESGGRVALLVIPHPFSHGAREDTRSPVCPVGLSVFKDKESNKYLVVCINIGRIRNI